MCQDYLDALPPQRFIEFFASLVLRIRFDHLKIMHRRQFATIGVAHADRHRHAKSIENRHDFQAISALSLANCIAAAIARPDVDIAFRVLNPKSYRPPFYRSASTAGKNLTPLLRHVRF
jgi:hypothetical protein